jgi:hypothetical protein
MQGIGAMNAQRKGAKGMRSQQIINILNDAINCVEKCNEQKPDWTYPHLEKYIEAVELVEKIFKKLQKERSCR